MENEINHKLKGWALEQETKWLQFKIKIERKKTNKETRKKEKKKHTLKKKKNLSEIDKLLNKRRESGILLIN